MSTTDIKSAVELGYSLGWSFTPLRGKRPMRIGWQRAERESLQMALDWAAQGNVGLRTGAASGIVVVDIDPGADTEHLPGDLPPTVEVRTGRGGRHLYYACSRPCPNSASKLAPHVDIRGDGGQVVYPGAVHPETGVQYEWVYGPDEYDIADLPDWVLDALTPAGTGGHTGGASMGYAHAALAAEVASVRSSTDGTRNDTLNSAAFSLGTLVGGGALDRGTVEAELLTAALACGLTDAESRATIRSGIEAGILEPRSAPERPAAARKRPQEARGEPTPRTDTPILIPGPHVDADGAYTEQTSGMFANAVLAALPDDALYRKSYIPGEILGSPGKRRWIEMSPDAARLLIDSHVRLCAWQGKETKVLTYKPCSRDHACLTLAAARGAECIRELTLLVAYPAYGPGFIRLAPGWHEGLYYDEPPDLEGLTPDMDIESIRGVLEELVIDFPFRDEASRQNFFGLLLTPLIAPACEGNRPMHLLLSPLERTGKTKLAEDVFGGVILGRPTPALQIAGHEEERDKRVLSLLLLGETLIHLDNLPPTVASAALASLLTATTYQGRLLGASRIVSLGNALTVVGSGNNTECSGEIAKRSVPIMLEPRTAHPEARTDFRHPDLRAHVRRNRRRILAALLGMIETWRSNGCPRDTGRMGGFETWSEAIGGIMRCSGFSLWRSNAADWARQADAYGQDMAVLVDSWAQLHGTARLTPAEVCRLAGECNVFGAEMERRTERGQVTCMGTILRRHAGRPVGQWIIRRVDARNGAEYYLEAQT